MLAKVVTFEAVPNCISIIFIFILCILLHVLEPDKLEVRVVLQGPTTATSNPLEKVGREGGKGSFNYCQFAKKMTF